MKIVFGDLWKYKGDIICITTNGVVTGQGKLVMGRGSAEEAKERFPGLDKLAGELVKTNGNIAQFVTLNLYIFPTKRHFVERADVRIIKRSALQLARDAKLHPEKIFILPRPGCGNGGLEWENVRPIIGPILPDNVHVITRGEY